ncbi:ROK family transcriptional regulator [uncultured Thioclava sp.]|uniref:ROK family transcriptional regulator n=1 Tax=uncultured Thioclava sp. TaxID=473858 RepID=UPI0025D9C14D|nr:ROK family transcriptional regulator [uncultured Thioclava sp.]
MSGTSSGAAAVHNRRVVIDAIRINGALSRADLARATRLAKQTLSNIIDELERDGLVVARDTVKEGRGKPATPYDLAPFGAFSIGLQIDRHLARTVVMNLVGDIVLRRDLKFLPSEPDAGLDSLIQLIAQTRADLAEIYPLSESRTVGLGVAMPGPFGQPTQDRSADDYTMARWQGVHLVERLAAATGLMVNVQNDASAAATAEKMTGKAHGMQNAICLYLGYGLGAGLILNRELFGGRNGNAGEIGMIRNLGETDRRAVMERSVALGGFCARFGLSHSDERLFERIETLLSEASPAVDEWLNNAACRLGWLAEMLQLIVDPEAIILCGTAPSMLIEGIVARANSALDDDLSGGRRLRLLAGHSDPWIVAIGAAAEPISRNFDPKYDAILKV